MSDTNNGDQEFSGNPEEIEVVDPRDESAEPIDLKEAKKAKQEGAGQDDEALKKAREDYLYLRAEFDNFRRQAIKERSELLKFGAERLVKDLLNVLDNFERALETDVNAENLSSFKEGIELTSNELKNTLKNHGVEDVDSHGVPFDPTIHEALTSEETDEVEPGHVLRIFKRAYKLHGKLVRPAQVVVAKEKSQVEASTAEENTSEEDPK